MLSVSKYTPEYVDTVRSRDSRPGLRSTRSGEYGREPVGHRGIPFGWTTPRRSLKYGVGDEIKLTEADYLLPAEGFFEEIEAGTS